jgi:phosphate transport system protein
MQRDIDRIRATVVEMSVLVERALQQAMEAFVSRDRRLATAVILRDRHIDEKEQELNQLCLGFLVRQQPAASPLRMAYAAIRISLELERAGDYAESIARQTMRISDDPVEVPRERYQEMADMSIAMLRDAAKAFATEDPDLARRTIEVEDTVDLLKSDLARDLVTRYRNSLLSFDSLDPLMQVNRRLERASDQARNICHEVIYMCTGELTRHQGVETSRVLFVDEHHGSLSQMAEALGSGLCPTGFVFSSAGLAPLRLPSPTIEFMQGKGVDLSRIAPKAIHEIPDLDQYQVVVALSGKVGKAFRRRTRRMVYIEWRYADPSAVTGSPEEIASAHEQSYERLRADVANLVAMMAGA